MAEWPIGTTIKSKGFYVLGWESATDRGLTSWVGDEPIVWAVALGLDVKKGVPLNLPSGVKLVCCADAKSALEQAKQLGGVVVFGWGPKNL